MNLLSSVNATRTTFQIVLVSSDLLWPPHIKAITNKAQQKASWFLSVCHSRSHRHYAHTLQVHGEKSRRILLSTPRIRRRSVTFWFRNLRLKVYTVQKTIKNCWHETSTLWGPFGSFFTHVSSTETWTPHPPPYVETDQTLFDQSFAALGSILWNAMPHRLNAIQDHELFKS